jgi:hypothetical protein
MDFIEKLPKYECYDTILVVVDRFSKYAHFMALKHPFSAQQAAQILLDQVVKLHGLPKTIVSGRDKIFSSSFWTHLLKLLGTKLNLSTAYHPQMDDRVRGSISVWRCTSDDNNIHCHFENRKCVIKSNNNDVGLAIRQYELYLIPICDHVNEIKVPSAVNISRFSSR